LGFTPQLVKREMPSTVLYDVLGKVITVEVDDGCFVSGKLIKFEAIGQAKHRPFVLVLLLPNGERIITKWMGIIYW
jgi:hypothetical protein